MYWTIFSGLSLVHWTSSKNFIWRKHSRFKWLLSCRNVFSQERIVVGYEVAVLVVDIVEINATLSWREKPTSWLLSVGWHPAAGSSLKSGERQVLLDHGMLLLCMWEKWRCVNAEEEKGSDSGKNLVLIYAGETAPIARPWVTNDSSASSCRIRCNQATGCIFGMPIWCFVLVLFTFLTCCLFLQASLFALDQIFFHFLSFVTLVSLMRQNSVMTHADVPRICACMTHDYFLSIRDDYGPIPRS